MSLQNRPTDFNNSENRERLPSGRLSNNINGLDVLAGVIDADYRGEIGCLIYNAGNEAIELPEQSKICQLIIEKIITPRAVWTEEPGKTERGAGGCGSTG